MRNEKKKIEGCVYERRKTGDTGMGAYGIYSTARQGKSQVMAEQKECEEEMQKLV